MESGVPFMASFCLQETSELCPPGGARGSDFSPSSNPCFKESLHPKGVSGSLAQVFAFLASALLPHSFSRLWGATSLQQLYHCFSQFREKSKSESQPGAESLSAFSPNHRLYSISIHTSQSSESGGVYLSLGFKFEKPLCMKEPVRGTCTVLTIHNFCLTIQSLWCLRVLYICV